jgi:hypothetical protein
MEQTQNEVQEQTATPSAARDDRPAPVAASVQPAAQTVSPQACSTCGTAPAANGGAAATSSYVYAIGNIEARSPSISVEKEFAQATGRADTKGLTDAAAQHAVLSKHENSYLARQHCFVMTKYGLETYILVPRSQADVSLLVEALRPTPTPMDLDVVIGTKGPIAPATMCNGLMVPIVFFDQIYSFDRDALLNALTKPDGISAEDFASASGQLFNRILQMTDNAGATEADRALNYLAVRYQAIYAKTAQYFAQNSSFSAIEVQPSPLSGVRNMVDVIMSYTDRTTTVVDKWSARVDVTDEFPFLVTPLSPYYDRY